MTGLRMSRAVHGKTAHDKAAHGRAAHDKTMHGRALHSKAAHGRAAHGKTHIASSVHAHREPTHLSRSESKGVVRTPWRMASLCMASWEYGMGRRPNSKLWL